MLSIDNITYQYNFEISNNIIDSESRIIINSLTSKMVASLSKPYRNILYLFYLFPNKVLSKLEIMSAGWEGKTVSESSVVVAISEIRAVVGSNRIITVTGEGYMLIGDE